MTALLSQLLQSLGLDLSIEPPPIQPTLCTKMRRNSGSSQRLTFAKQSFYERLPRLDYYLHQLREHLVLAGLEEPVMTATTTLACASDISVDAQSLKIAFASSDGDLVDQHFGSAQGFFLYGVNEQEAELLGSKSFPHALKDGNEDKLKPRLAWKTS